MAVCRVKKTRDYTVMSNSHFRDKNLSLKSIGLLSIMLSLPDDWDYTVKGLSYIMKDGINSINTGIKELEKYGYITRERVRNAKGQLAEIEYTIHEHPVNPENQPDRACPKQEKPELEKPKQGNPILDKPELDCPEQEKPVQGEPALENHHQLNTKVPINEKPNTDLSITNQSIGGSEPFGAGVTDAVSAYRAVIKDNIDYEFLCLNYSPARVDEILNLIVDVVCPGGKSIRINGVATPANLVRQRFMNLSAGNIEYVFSCIDSTTSKINNIRSYMITTLYNAPCTTESYFTTKVNNDLYVTEGS